MQSGVRTDPLPATPRIMGVTTQSGGWTVPTKATSIKLGSTRTHQKLIGGESDVTSFQLTPKIPFLFSTNHNPQYLMGSSLSLQVTANHINSLQIYFKFFYLFISKF